MNNVHTISELSELIPFKFVKYLLIGGSLIAIVYFIFIKKKELNLNKIGLAEEKFRTKQSLKNLKGILSKQQNIEAELLAALNHEKLEKEALELQNSLQNHGLVEQSLSSLVAENSEMNKKDSLFDDILSNKKDSLHEDHHIADSHPGSDLQKEVNFKNIEQEVANVMQDCKHFAVEEKGNDLKNEMNSFVNQERNEFSNPSENGTDQNNNELQFCEERNIVEEAFDMVVNEVSKVIEDIFTSENDESNKNNNKSSGHHFDNHNQHNHGGGRGV